MALSPIDNSLKSSSGGNSSTEQAIPKTSGTPLHQLFDHDKDTLDIEKSNVETETPSFFKRIAGWFSTSSKEDLTVTHSQVPPSISSVPSLEEPSNTTLLPPITTQKKSPTILQKDFNDALEEMSQKTVEQILFIVLREQIEIEKDHANAIDSTHLKYQDFKKIQGKILEEVRDVIAKDQGIAKKLKTTQNVALFATSISGLVAAIAKLGAPVPPAIVIIAAVCSGSFSALVGGGKTYFNYRSKEEMAKHELFTHKDKHLDNQLEHTRQFLNSTSDADNMFKERLVGLLKRAKKMNRLILQK